MSAKQLRSHKRVMVILGLGVSVLVGILIVLLSWYIGQASFWAYPIFRCKGATYVAASPLGYIIEAERESRSQPPYWPVKKLRGRAIGSWNVVWEFPLQAEHVYVAKIQGVSNDGRVVAIVALVNSQPREAQCFFLDVATGTALWRWPGNDTGESVKDVIFINTRVAYATVQHMGKDAAEGTCIYRLDLATKNATLYAHARDLGFDKCRLSLVGYCKASGQLILIAEEEQGPGVYAIHLENPETRRLMLRLKKDVIGSRTFYSHAASSEGSAFAFASDDEITFLRSPPEFSECNRFFINGLTPWISCSPDGQCFAASGFRRMGLPAEVHVFNFDRLIGKFHSHRESVIHYWLPDGKHLAVSDHMCLYSIWRVRIPKR